MEYGDSEQEKRELLLSDDIYSLGTGSQYTVSENSYRLCS